MFTYLCVFAFVCNWYAFFSLIFSIFREWGFPYYLCMCICVRSWIVCTIGFLSLYCYMRSTYSQDLFKVVIVLHVYACKNNFCIFNVDILFHLFFIKYKNICEDINDIFIYIKHMHARTQGKNDDRQKLWQGHIGNVMLTTLDAWLWPQWEIFLQYDRLRMSSTHLHMYGDFKYFF